MGPWGENYPLTPEKVLEHLDAIVSCHCSDLCCDDQESCRCNCSWCDCRYAARLGS